MPRPDGRRSRTEPLMCEACEQPITGTGVRYCSHACYNKRRKTIDSEGRRQCRECGTFFFDHENVRRAGNWCRACRDAYYREYNSTVGKEASRNRYVRKMYGITQADYDRMLAAQGGQCAICQRLPREDAPLHIDHCHATGTVRGLLCFNCNVSIGKLQDDPALLLRAADYLLGFADATQEVTTDGNG